MTEIWEATFKQHSLIWGAAPARSALLAKDLFVAAGAESVLIPGVGYGRNARVFLENGMSVTGIEISETAIGLSRTELGLDIPIHHGAVADMPFDDQRFDGIFCYGLIYLLPLDQRERLLRDCERQLACGGQMVFTVISKKAPMYGQGTKLGDDWYEILPNMQMYFYDDASVEREFGPHGLVEYSEIEEPFPDGGSFPFINVVCKRDGGAPEEEPGSRS